MNPWLALGGARERERGLLEAARRHHLARQMRRARRQNRSVSAAAAPDGSNRSRGRLGLYRSRRVADPRPAPRPGSA